jgi:hypothetical protein
MANNFTFKKQSSTNLDEYFVDIKLKNQIVGFIAPPSMHGSPKFKVYFHTIRAEVLGAWDNTLVHKADSVGEAKAYVKENCQKLQEQYDLFVVE